MGIQDILALTIVSGAVFYVTRSFWRTLGSRDGPGCHCSHSHPPAESNNTSATDSMRIKRNPLVPLDQIGVPQKNKSTTGKCDQ